MNKSQIKQSEQFHELLCQVQDHLDRRRPNHDAIKTQLLTEKERLSEQCRGWQLSLGNPELDPTLRSELEQTFTSARSRIQEIDVQISDFEAEESQTRAAVDPDAVADRLENLSTLLEGDNASATNVALAQHIDAIECHPNGEVVVRTCLLGVVANTEELTFAIREQAEGTIDTCHESRREAGSGRRRTRRNLGDMNSDDEATDATNEFAIDPHRYRGLGSEWFTEHTFQIPKKLSWSEENAQAVANFRLEQKATMEVTAQYFGKTPKTILRALKYAKDQFGLDALGKEVSRSTHRHWAKENAQQVAEFFRQPEATMKAAEAHFGKSQPTLSKAKKYAREMELESSHSSSACEKEYGSKGA